MTQEHLPVSRVHLPHPLWLPLVIPRRSQPTPPRTAPLEIYLADVLRLGARLANLRLLVPHARSGEPPEECERPGADLALGAEVLLRHANVAGVETRREQCHMGAGSWESYGLGPRHVSQSVAGEWIGVVVGGRSEGRRRRGQQSQSRCLVSLEECKLTEVAGGRGRGKSQSATGRDNGGRGLGPGAYLDSIPALLRSPAREQVSSLPLRSASVAYSWEAFWRERRVAKGEGETSDGQEARPGGVLR